MKKRKPDGFTLVELLIWGSIMMIAAAFGLPALQQQMVRARLINACEQIGVHAQVARIEAVRLGIPVVFAPNFERRSIFAFHDDNDDLVQDVGEEVVFDVAVPGGGSQVGVYFMGPLGVAGTGAAPGDSLWGFSTFTNLASQTVPGAVFDPDGSIQETGGFRLADGRSPRANVCEVRIEPRATARVELLKYVYAGPPGAPDYFPRGSRSWKWY